MKINSFRKTRRDEVLTLMVFNDMVVLAAPVLDKNIFKSRKGDTARLRVLSIYEGGLGTVEDVREVDCSSATPSFSLTVRSPGDGHVCTTSYSMAPQSSLSRRAQRNTALPGAGLESYDLLVEAIEATRSSGKEV